MTDREIEVLALYKAERARGIVHTPEWEYKMHVLQARFDQWYREQYQKDTPK